MSRVVSETKLIASFWKIAEKMRSVNVTGERRGDGRHGRTDIHSRMMMMTFWVGLEILSYILESW